MTILERNAATYIFSLKWLIDPDAVTEDDLERLKAEFAKDPFLSNSWNDDLLYKDGTDDDGLPF